MSSSKVRVRFAPSPTGPLHMGGVRTALYNYLFAKNQGGTFILRVEDTDQTRYVNGAEDYIFEALKWCGIEPDESAQHGGNYGPYRQSERKHLYENYARQLVTDGHAYYAFDTPEELEAMRERLKRAKVASPQYNAVTRSTMKNSLTLSEDEVNARMKAGKPYVIRLKIPRNEEVRFHDEIRGWVVVHSSNIDDKVIFKSDGMPTYHLANIVDDHLMEITHVIRGEEWLPSAPLHVLLYRFLGWEATMPKFAHLPLILKPDGNGKLSKRDGDRLGFPVFPLEWKDPKTGDIASGYREKGYFPDAFVNMLAFLGWNPGTNQEVFTREELTAAFSLDRVGKAGAKFDADKTKWFNQQYLRATGADELARLMQPHVERAGYTFPLEYLAQISEPMKERATFIEEMISEGEFFFEAPQAYDEQTVAKKWKADSSALLQKLHDRFDGLDEFDATTTEATFKQLLADEEVGFGKIGLPFRLALTGKGMGPSLFQICDILGKREVMNRLERALQVLPA